MRRFLRLLALASLVGFVALPAVAQQGRAYNQALGLSFGLADLETGNETVLGAGFRFRIAGPPAEDSRGGMRGYLEPEVQYLESDFEVDRFDVSSEDLMFGLNLVGVVPFGAVDTFFGGGPTYHMLDLSSELSGLESSEDSIGLNIHVGVDIHLSDVIALGIVGRLDLLEDALDEEQTKILMALRIKFD